MPLPTVFATATPNTNIAKMLKNIAKNAAALKDRTLVATMVAIEFAESFIPFKKSKINATIMVIITSVSTSIISNHLLHVSQY